VVNHAPTAPGADQQDRPVLLPDSDPPRAARPSRGMLAGLAVLVVLALVLAGWLLLRGGDDSQVSTTPGAGAQQPAAIAPLSLTVDPVVGAEVGQPATLVVHYADGTGVFAGSTEEWGDDVGTSSLAEDVCPSPSPSPAAAPLKGTYQATHTWAAPGSYPVKVAVSSYTCVDGAPVVEQATTTVTVEVAAK
jgi:hypothetical protein